MVRLLALLFVFASAEIVRRQNYFHFCGTSPTYQWLSYYPCNHSPNTQFGQCSNGGVNIGLFCTFDYQCYSYGICLNGRCCTGAASIMSTQSPICGERETSNGYCRSGACNDGFLCTSEHICCRCASGTSAGPCVNNHCPAGYTCNSAGQCCTGTVHVSHESVPNRFLECVNGLCPSGYNCRDRNLCFPALNG